MLRLSNLFKMQMANVMSVVNNGNLMQLAISEGKSAGTA